MTPLRAPGVLLSTAPVGHADMTPMTGLPGSAFFVMNAVLLAAAGYVVGVRRLRGRGIGWPVARSAVTALGLGCVVIGVLPAPGLDAFPAHVLQHLLIAMLAPLLLALGAPITLALRTVGPRARLGILRLLHSSPVRVMTLAPVVLVLHIGGLYAFYLTPLFDIAHGNSMVAAVIHLHMFLTGCLLSALLVGADPIRNRPGLVTSLVVLLIAAATHDILAKFMYAHGLPAGAGPTDQLQMGAQLMYYGGTVVEVALGIAVLSRWYAASGRELRRQQRRQVVPGSA
ncbi:cytochrome c oxidase assembly protein [Nakamurella sp. GG22]